MAAVEDMLSILVALLAGVLAWAVLQRRPRRPIDVGLARLLVLEAAVALLFLSRSSEEPAHVMLRSLWLAAGPVSVAVYGSLLSHLDGPVPELLRRQRVKRALATVATASVFVALAIGAARAFAGVDTRSWEAVGDIASSTCAIAISLLGLGVSLASLRASRPGTLLRRRAGAYAIAFGARDVLLVAGITIGTIFVGSWPAPPDAPGWALLASQLLPRLGFLAFIVLLVVGVRATRLFDIDLRVRTLVRRGSLSAFLLALIAGALVFLTEAAGLPWRAAGGLGVAVALVALVPLHMLADRLSRALVPEEESVEAHLSRRRERAEAWESEERFVVERELGRGGFGRALLAHDLVLQRRVVLKRPLEGASRAQQDAWLGEARAHARVKHPNVVIIHEIIVDANGPALVLEHVEGGSLADRLRKDGPLGEEEAARVLEDVLSGLAAIHAQGLVHADLKPSNVLLDEAGRAKLSDFGAVRDPAARGPVTPAYASPEQRAGGPLDARSDIYGAGVLLRAMIGAAPPEQGTRDAGRIEDALHLDVRQASPFDPVIARATASDRARRFSSADEMARGIRLVRQAAHQASILS